MILFPRPQGRAGQQKTRALDFANPVSDVSATASGSIYKDITPRALWPGDAKSAYARRRRRALSADFCGVDRAFFAAAPVISGYCAPALFSFWLYIYARLSFCVLLLLCGGSCATFFVCAYCAA